jgi:hypothetical protein
MNPLYSIAEYEQFIYALPENYPQIKFSTLVLKRYSQFIGEVSGTIYFESEIKLNVKELIDFRKAVIKAYSYEVYSQGEKQYWYDPQPHPDDPSLQSSFPHHKHLPPDIKHHRIPAESISFHQVNLPFLIQEVIDNLLQ